jgi:hypothetical protein
MSSTATAEAIGILVVFLGGVGLGILTIVSMAIRREDRRLSLTHIPPNAVTRGARVLTGVGSVRTTDTWTEPRP